MIEANSYSISKAFNIAYRALPLAFNISRPSGGSQTFHFCVALTYKGTTILSSMRFELKSLSDSELTTYLMKLVLLQQRPTLLGKPL